MNQQGIVRLHRIRIQVSKKKKDFFSSITKKRSKQNTDNEIDKYIKFCKNVDQLYDFPTIELIYKRYNVALPSSASVGRLFSQRGLIILPRRLKLTDKLFETLLFLKLNHIAYTEDIRQDFFLGPLSNT
ncbi:Uncharacterized protein APZ42_024976 [Daphnia magna]|uniref:HAT C-terminal dimerisation domain-containing protein n=1 Tax=Daphnia magna TaxID=35525 RepID=A0A164TKT0_9CRUS|nr:Uncharacterized protein APZ42_024976 [Daphnia magna]